MFLLSVIFSSCSKYTFVIGMPTVSPMCQESGTEPWQSEKNIYDAGYIFH